MSSGLTALGLLISLLAVSTCSGQVETVQKSSVDIGLELNVDEQFVVVVSGLQDLASGKINVWVDGANQTTDPPLVGTTKFEKDRIVFVPRFPMLPGMNYSVVVESGVDSKPIRETVRLPAKAATAAQVIAIYPSPDALPENLLKFYIHFSKPMRKGDVYRYFRLRESGGKDVELPFLEIEQEFWSRDSTRLTLLLDPGRIKRGLKPREEMGPILVAGQEYELIIDGEWPDADGKKLGKDFVKQFRALPEDHGQPDPATWKIWLPTSQTKTPLVIRFPEPLDHSMLLRSIFVSDQGANEIVGITKVTDHEQRWSFEPSQAWRAGQYSISINPDLEDNAGNSVGRQFDVDVFEETEPSDHSAIIELKFQIKK